MGKKVNMTFDQVYKIVEPLEGWMCEADCRVLYDLAKKAKRIVEIGAYGGRSTITMALSSPKSHITVIDPYKNEALLEDYNDIYLGFIQTIKKLGIKNITHIKQRSQDANINFKIDLLHIDGDHLYEAVKGDIEKYVPMVKGTVIFHDYPVQEFGVKQAVDELKDKYFISYEMASGFFKGVTK